MALANGAVDGVLLFPAAGSSGARLRFGTANRWAKCRAEVHRRYGWWPEVTSAGDGYRDLATQVRIFLQRYSLTDSGWRGAGHIKTYQGRRYYIRTNPLTGRPYAVAATPGESNHGWAKAVDVAGLTSMVLTRWVQFADVATEFGLSNAEGQSIGEAWHWVDTLDPDDALDGSTPSATSDPTPTPEEEDDMQYTPQEMVRFAQEGALAAREATLADDKQRLAETLRENVGDGGTAGGTGAPWFVQASDRRTAETLRANIGDIAAANPASWMSIAMRTYLGGADVDAAELAKSLVSMLVPAVVAALADDVGLTEDQVQAASERAIRNVLQHGIS